MELTKEETQILELSQEARQFRQSKLFQALQAHLSMQLDKEYPEPKGLFNRWVEKYRYAKAYEKASTDIISFFLGLDSQYEMLSKKVKDVETSIEDA